MYYINITCDIYIYIHALYIYMLMYILKNYSGREGRLAGPQLSLAVVTFTPKLPVSAGGKETAVP